MIPDIFKADATLAAAAAAAVGKVGATTTGISSSNNNVDIDTTSDGGGNASTVTAAGTNTAAATDAACIAEAEAVVQEFPGFATVIRMDFVQEAGQTVFVPAGWCSTRIALHYFTSSCTMI